MCTNFIQKKRYFYHSYVEIIKFGLILTHLSLLFLFLFFKFFFGGGEENILGGKCPHVAPPLIPRKPIFEYVLRLKASLYREGSV